ncbi:MAG: hypothetical protein JXR07_05270 [Reichenbachiella sp.]
MRITTLYILAAVLTLFSFQEVKMSKSAQKKMGKAISGVWDVEWEAKDLAFKSTETVEKEFSGAEKVMILTEAGGSQLGYAVIAQAKGRYDLFDLLIIYDLDLNIKATQVLVYREDWGGEIASARWMRQFIGKGNQDKIALTHDIQGISGATISCQSATQEIRKMTSIVHKLKEEGALNI